ncbi:hypothetical protein TURU_017421 [Turdus rufiventris]|nr:hypothetical protein TURU_017421 [Turdus rufiventris]
MDGFGGRTSNITPRRTGLLFDCREPSSLRRCLGGRREQRKPRQSPALASGHCGITVRVRGNRGIAASGSAFVPAGPGTPGPALPGAAALRPSHPVLLEEEQPRSSSRHRRHCLDMNVVLQDTLRKLRDMEVELHGCSKILRLQANHLDFKITQQQRLIRELEAAKMKIKKLEENAEAARLAHIECKYTMQLRIQELEDALNEEQGRKREAVSVAGKKDFRESENAHERGIKVSQRQRASSNVQWREGAEERRETEEPSGRSVNPATSFSLHEGPVVCHCKHKTDTMNSVQQNQEDASVKMSEQLKAQEDCTQKENQYLEHQYSNLLAEFHTRAQSLSDAKVELRRRDQILNQQKKLLKDMEQDRQWLREALQEAEDALQQAAKDNELIINHMKAVDATLNAVKNQAMAPGAAAATLLPSLQLQILPEEAMRGRPEAAAFQDVLISFMDFYSLAAAREEASTTGRESLQVHFEPEAPVTPPTPAKPLQFRFVPQGASTHHGPAPDGL